MKIAEAKQKLMQLADGKYHSIEYALVDNGIGSITQSCKLYITGQGSFEAPHWESAFAQLADATSDKPKLSEDFPASALSAAADPV